MTDTDDTPQARLRRFLALVEQAPAWADKPFPEVFDHFTRGMGKADKGAVARIALELISLWATQPPHAALAAADDGLPSLRYAIDWAAYTVGTIVTRQFTHGTATDEPSQAAA